MRFQFFEISRLMEFPLEKFYDFEEDLRLKIYYIGSSQGHLRPVEVQLLSEPSGLTKSEARLVCVRSENEISRRP